MALEIPDNVKKFLVAVVLLVIIDIPWLTMVSNINTAVVADIQCGKQPYYRLNAALPVYIALAYLVLQVKDTRTAFLTGLSTYVVYDFTVYVVFQKYPIWLALADSLWGGILFVLVFNILKWLK